jgi:acyl-CoA synthetase (NDP forming)
VELMLGVTMDPVFGPLVAFGLGGTDVEALGDVTFRVLPVTDTDARSMLTAIRGHRLLEGYRGRPPVDRDALTQAILRLARLAEELPEVAEIDLNPVLALTQGGLAIADARVRIDPALRPTQP